jgi:hypothetical protein
MEFNRLTVCIPNVRQRHRHHRSPIHRVHVAWSGRFRMCRCHHRHPSRRCCLIRCCRHDHRRNHRYHPSRCQSCQSHCRSCLSCPSCQNCLSYPSRCPCRQTAAEPTELLQFEARHRTPVTWRLPDWTRQRRGLWKPKEVFSWEYPCYLISTTGLPLKSLCVGMPDRRLARPVRHLSVCKFAFSGLPSYICGK